MEEMDRIETSYTKSTIKKLKVLTKIEIADEEFSLR
jgi:hypothetical protein